MVGGERVAVRRSERARKMRIRVLNEGFELVLPKRVSGVVVHEFLRASEEWVRAHGEKVRARAREGDVTKIWWAGAELTVVADPGFLGVELDLDKGQVRVGAETVLEGRRLVEKKFREWARPLFLEVVERRAEEMGVLVGRIRVGDQRSRWGSCSAKGTISLNWRLVMAPVEVLDYLVVHELAHRKEMNHSGRFWGVVEEYCPRYREWEEWLKKEGHALMRRWS